MFEFRLAPDVARFPRNFQTRSPGPPAVTSDAPRRPGRAALCGLAALLAAPATMAGDLPPRWSYGERGGVGLLQAPNARFADDGRLAVGYAHACGRRDFHLAFQALAGLETVFRYAGPGGGRAPDADAKLRLLEETASMPALAAGLRGVLGPGTASGAYFAASKRFYDLDASIGFGYGRRAWRGDVGGLALFGGVEYLTPLDGLRLKVEIDGPPARPETGGRLNFGLSYSPYPGVAVAASSLGGRDLAVSTTASMNLDMPPAAPGPARPATRAEAPPSPPSRRAARFHDRVEAAGFEVAELAHGGTRLDATVAVRGHAPPRAAIRRTIRESARALGLPVDSVEVVLIDAEPGGGDVRDGPERAREARFAATLRRELAAQGLELTGLRLAGGEAVIGIENRRYRNPAVAVGRAARAAANALPAPVEVITVALSRRGVETARVPLLRKDLENALAGRGSPAEIWHNAQTLRLEDAEAPAGPRAVGGGPAAGRAKIAWSVAPELRQDLWGGDGRRRTRFRSTVRATLPAAPGIEIDAALSAGVGEGFERAASRAPDGLAAVRSAAARSTGNAHAGIDVLQARHMRSPAPGLHARLSAGYLEEGFAGFGGEVLYRPRGGRWAVGAELYGVRQRDLDRALGLRDYQAVTGHLDLYYETPAAGYLARLGLGRYLAGDWGGTLELVRRFRSGIRVGGFVTLTDAPPEPEDGGRLGKGLFAAVPLDLFAAGLGRARARYDIRPLARDSGQRLRSSPRLYDLTEGAGLDDVRRGWPALLD